MRKTLRLLGSLSILGVITAGALALAKPPPPPPPPGQSCNSVVCAQCPPGYTLQKGEYPNCCLCVPGPEV
jgi:hypothetical protein